MNHMNSWANDMFSGGMAVWTPIGVLVVVLLVVWVMKMRVSKK